MIHEISTVVKYILQKDIAGPHYRGLPDDTFIACFPRSGSTWIRMLITALMHPEEPLTLDLMERTVWDSTAQSLRVINRAPHPRLVKVHQSFDPRIRRVIYVVRDPRDVAISYYHFQLKYRYLQDGYPIEQFVERFVAGDASRDYGSWGEHVGSWLAARYDSPCFLLVRYEDLKVEPVLELGRIASFLGIESLRLADAAGRCTPERLRELEKLEQETWVATRDRRMDIPFFGPARAGRWKGALPLHSVVLIESKWGPLMKALRYELTQVDAVPLAPPFVIFGDSRAPVVDFAHSGDTGRNS